MILTDGDLYDWAVGGNIFPFEVSRINPASIDLCLGNEWRDFLYQEELEYPDSNGKISLYKTSSVYDQLHQKLPRWLRNHFKHKPSAILAITKEWIRIPDNMAAEIKLKTTPSRLGFGHPIADWVDPGYEGKLTLMLSCVKDVSLPAGIPIVQLVIYKLEKRVKVPYSISGHYQGQRLPTVARSDYA